MSLFTVQIFDHLGSIFGKKKNFISWKIGKKKGVTFYCTNFWPFYLLKNREKKMRKKRKKASSSRPVVVPYLQKKILISWKIGFFFKKKKFVHYTKILNSLYITVPHKTLKNPKGFPNVSFAVDTLVHCLLLGTLGSLKFSKKKKSWHK